MGEMGKQTCKYVVRLISDRQPSALKKTQVICFEGGCRLGEWDNAWRGPLRR